MGRACAAPVSLHPCCVFLAWLKKTRFFDRCFLRCFLSHGGWPQHSPEDAEGFCPPLVSLRFQLVALGAGRVEGHRVKRVCIWSWPCTTQCADFHCRVCQHILFGCHLCFPGTSRLVQEFRFEGEVHALLPSGGIIEASFSYTRIVTFRRHQGASFSHRCFLFDLHDALVAHLGATGFCSHRAAKVLLKKKARET